MKSFYLIGISLDCCLTLFCSFPGNTKRSTLSATGDKGGKLFKIHSAMR